MENEVGTYHDILEGSGVELFSQAGPPHYSSSSGTSLTKNHPGFFRDQAGAYPAVYAYRSFGFSSFDIYWMGLKIQYQDYSSSFKWWKGSEGSSRETQNESNCTASLVGS